MIGELALDQHAEKHDGTENDESCHGHPQSRGSSWSVSTMPSSST